MGLRRIEGLYEPGLEENPARDSCAYLNLLDRTVLKLVKPGYEPSDRGGKREIGYFNFLA